MKTRVGVWIDHRKAVIVVVTDTGEEIRLIISQTKAAPPCWGFPAQGPYEAEQVPADDSRERKCTGQFNIYYDAVIVGIREADSLLILGPGKAKGELTKRLERHHFSTPKLVTERLSTLRHVVGLSGIIMEPNVGGRIPHQLLLHSMRLFAQEVTPYLR